MYTKKSLRTEILSMRNSLSQEERVEKSNVIANNLIQTPEFLNADILLLYASNKSEVDTKKIHLAAQEKGKIIYYPKVEGKEMEFYPVQNIEDLEEGFCGIKEPNPEIAKRYVAESGDKICVIMPGAVFDNEGNRIGYGGGYYDKYLHRLMKSVPANHICKIAIGFACQVVETGEIPIEEYDVKYDLLITE